MSYFNRKKPNLSKLGSCNLCWSPRNDHLHPRDGPNPAQPSYSFRNGTLPSFLPYVTPLHNLTLQNFSHPFSVGDKTLDNSAYSHQLNNKQIGVQELWFHSCLYFSGHICTPGRGPFSPRSPCGLLSTYYMLDLGGSFTKEFPHFQNNPEKLIFFFFFTVFPIFPTSKSTKKMNNGPGGGTRPVKWRTQG